MDLGVVQVLVVPACFLVAAAMGPQLRAPQAICWLVAAVGLGHLVAFGLSSVAIHRGSGALGPWLHLASQVCFGLGFAVLVPLVAAYPDGVRRLQRIVWASLAVAVVLPVVGAVAGPSPTVLQPGGEVTLRGPVVSLLPAGLSAAGAGVFALPMVAAGLFAWRYRRGTPAEKRRLRWPMLGVTIMAVLVVMGLTLGTALPAATDAAFLIAAPVLPLAIMAGSARQRLLDIDRASRRAVVFGGSWALFAAAYGVGSAAAAWASSARSLSVALLLGGVISITLAGPVRRSLLRLADDRARLTDVLHRRLADLEESRHRLATAEDAARLNFERDLHDGAQQEVLALLTHIEIARTPGVAEAQREQALARAAQLGQGAYESIRRIAHGVRPPVLEDRGLTAAVAARCADSLVPVQLLTEGASAGQRWKPDIEGVSYSFVQEALTNVAKHARATRAVVALRAEGERLVLEVADDGRGGLEPQGFGLRGLRDRVEAVGGWLDTSEAGGWTRLRASFPDAAGPA
jgi:signal transduction histidine kinase